MRSIIVLKFDNLIGGIENFLLDMQAQLEDRIKFIFITETRFNMHENQILSKNGEIIKIPREDGLLPYLSNLYKNLKLQRNKTDTIYLNIGDYSHEKLAILMIAKRLKYHVVIHSHGGKMELSKNSFIHSLSHWIIRHCSLYYTRNCTRLAVSHRAGSFLFGGQTFNVLSSGIDMKRFYYNDSVREELRKKLQCQQKFVIGFVGRMVEIKNPNFAIQIINEFCNIFGKGNVLLMMIGDGPLLDDMKQMAKKNNLKDEVLFVGATDQVCQYLQVMDCVIGTSFSEAMPLSMLEAQASGLPCVCAQGRYPDEIAVTPLVHMIPLESGAKKWAELLQQIQLKETSNTRAQAGMNPALEPYESKNLAGKLYQYLTSVTTVVEDIESI